MFDLDNPPLALIGVTVLAFIAPVIYSFIVDRYAPNRYQELIEQQEKERNQEERNQ